MVIALVILTIIIFKVTKSRRDKEVVRETGLSAVTKIDVTIASQIIDIENKIHSFPITVMGGYEKITPDYKLYIVDIVKEKISPDNATKYKSSQIATLQSPSFNFPLFYILPTFASEKGATGMLLKATMQFTSKNLSAYLIANFFKRKA